MTYWAESSVQGYEVSDDGRVRNAKTKHEITPHINQSGRKRVLISTEHGRTNKMVSTLVAEAFVEPPFPHADTPIHKDGDYKNCNADNLEWRTRSYAIRFHNQFKKGFERKYYGPIEEIESGLVFDVSFDAAIYYGIIATHAEISAIHDDLGQPVVTVSPGRLSFRWVKD